MGRSHTQKRSHQTHSALSSLLRPLTAAWKNNYPRPSLVSGFLNLFIDISKQQKPELGSGLVFFGGLEGEGYGAVDAVEKFSTLGPGITAIFNFDNPVFGILFFPGLYLLVQPLECVYPVILFFFRLRNVLLAFPHAQAFAGDDFVYKV